jgi:hypothetical protein
MRFSSCLYNKLLQLHRVGILHGDFEPRNVALGPRGVILLDFSHSSDHHSCNGETLCHELVYARSILELELVGRFNSSMERADHHFFHLGISVGVPLTISIAYFIYWCL